MMYCDSCLAYKRLTLFEGKSSCEACGKVLDEDNFTEDPGFEKNLNGQSRLSGVNVRTIQSDSASRERTISIANYDITGMMTALQINGGDSISGPAVKLYTIALERGFTRGRRKEYVEAACLYISLREQKKPYLLIDLSEYLRVNVYVLGAVFLQLCKLLSLEEHPIVQKPVDPSLFIHRFTDRLFGDKKGDITRTALNIVASMKRDWIQTGRKPSGLCGAAIYIAALSHGHKCLKSDVIKVVHVCENTLTKRLIEFENTDSGSLTIEEFNTKAREIEDIEKKSPKQPKQSGGTEDIELRCEHKDRQPFAHGVCGECYADLVRLSGGIDGGSEPPAFARAEMERRIAREAAENAKCGEEANIENVSQKENPVLTGEKSNGVEGNACEEEDSDNFADIDDSEVECYFLNKEEQKLKEIVWSEVNKEYLEEQAAKKAAELAERKAFEANFKGRPEELQAALELAAASKAAVSKSRKERNQKRAAEKKEQGPPKDAKEATKQMLRTKRLSSKINYEELDKLFDDPLLNSENSPKKRKIEEEDNNDEIKRDEDNNNNEYNQDLYHEGEEGYEEGYEGHEGYEEGYYEDQNQDDY